MESQGIVRYDPGKNGPWKGKTQFASHWAAVLCRNDIQRYYSWFVRREARTCLQAPVWGAHISICRGEEPRCPEFWMRHDGRVLKFQFSGDIQTNGLYWWLPIESEDILDIREELGLTREPFMPLHLSLGQEIPWDFESMLTINPCEQRSRPRR